MAEYDNIIATLKDMELADLSLLQADLTKITQEKAIKELSRREEEINQLRLMAGLKAKPVQKPKAASTPPAPTDGVRKGPKPGWKAERAAAAAREADAREAAAREAAK